MEKMTKEEIELMESSDSEEAWNRNCDTIKTSRNGQYPSDWWQVMKLSGKMDVIIAKFGASSELKITAFKVK